MTLEISLCGKWTYSMIITKIFIDGGVITGVEEEVDMTLHDGSGDGTGYGDGE